MIKNGGAQPFIDSATKVVLLIIHFGNYFSHSYMNIINFFSPLGGVVISVGVGQ